MLRQYCFLNASATKISSRHSLKAGSITTQHLIDSATHDTVYFYSRNVAKKALKKFRSTVFRRTQF